MTDKRKKKLTAVGAVVLAAIIALGGTFAWQSISQQALNEASAVVNPGGRLHDDFDGSNKDVYVENFTDASDGTPIFARVRLDEYMELGTGAGTDRNLAQGEALTKTGLTVVGQGSKINDKSTWITRKPGGGSAFEEYYTWDMEGGQTVYMPTFNKNKDSLKADVNGTYDGKPDTNVPYDDYVPCTVGQQITADTTYDDDNNDIDDDGVRTENETHTAQETINGTVITMEEWTARWQAYQTAVEGGTDAEQAAADTQVKGDFWVWDADGWAYWANPIEPGTATGLLLDGIELTNPPSDSFYYGINAVGQFVTADDIGYLNGTGFYDRSAGRVPSANAENLLELITGTTIEVPPTEGEMDASISDEILGAVVMGNQYNIVTIDDTEWYVLAVDYDTDRALILSRYVLEERAFDADGDVYWKDSDLRTYLNDEWLSKQGELYNAAVETTLYEVDNTGVLSTTSDKVFLLSKMDISGYDIDDPRLATYYEWDGTGEGQGDVLPKDLTAATTKDGTKTSWWTRSYKPATSDSATAPVNYVYLNDGSATPRTSKGVRPAMWIQLETDKAPTVSDTLDFETSADIRAAEIQSASTLSTDSYDTVLIDGVEWYVLKVQDDKALLLSKYAESEEMDFIGANRNVSEEQRQRFFPTANKIKATSTSDAIWATGAVHDYLNGRWLSMHPTLSAAAAETEIKTRFYIYDDDTEYWVTSNDKVFVLSEADVYGTTFDVTQDTWMNTNTTTAKAQEYTLGTAGIILPESLRKTFTLRNTDSEAHWLLRNSRHYTSGSGTASISGIAAVAGGSIGSSDGTGNLTVFNHQAAQGYCRPAVWVNLNPTYASIQVTPPAEAVEYNSRVQLPVSVSVGASPVTSPTVSWTIRGATSADTKITGNTLFIGADEQNTRIQVVASYLVDGQTITDTIYVTVNPAPARLNAEDSAAIRAADISKKGLELPAESYDVINFDGLDFYVLAVDEKNDLALIFSKDIVGTGRMGNDSSANWSHVQSGARNTLNGSWLNAQPTLSQVAQETEIRFYTLGGYSSNPQLKSSVDTVFIPSYADVTGLSAMDQTSPAVEGEEGEYTWNNQKLIPESLLPATCIEGVTESFAWWLRSSDNQYNQKAHMLAVDKDEGRISTAYEAGTSRGLRPMMWIRISEE